ADRDDGAGVHLRLLAAVDGERIGRGFTAHFGDGGDWRHDVGNADRHFDDSGDVRGGGVPVASICARRAGDHGGFDASTGTAGWRWSYADSGRRPRMSICSESVTERIDVKPGGAGFSLRGALALLRTGRAKARRRLKVCPTENLSRGRWPSLFFA